MYIKFDFKVFVYAGIFILTKNISTYNILMLFGMIHELGHMLCGLLLRF